MNEKDATLLDNYFNDLLPEAEALTVRQRARDDPEFAAEFALRQEIETWLQHEPQRQALAENLTQIGPAFFGAADRQPSLQVVQVNWPRRAAIAAAFALLLAAVWFVFSPRPSLYQQYAQFTPMNVVERGAADADKAVAQTAFNQKNYPEALAALDRWLLAVPNDPTAALYKGMCLLALHRPVEARTTFQPLTDNDTALKADAIWYTALAYLLENDKNRCRSTLQLLTSDDDHYQEAQKLLHDL